MGWADELVPEAADTEVLAAYDHPHFGRFPAVTSRAYGAGRITYVGTLPDPLFGSALAEWVLRSAGVSPAGEGLPESVRVTRSTTRDGRRLAFVANWSFDPHVLTEPPVAGTLLFSGEPVGAQRELAPWDIQIIVEAG